jgi:hypothetical protein
VLGHRVIWRLDGKQTVMGTCKRGRKRGARTVVHWDIQPQTTNLFCPAGSGSSDRYIIKLDSTIIIANNHFGFDAALMAWGDVE